jgi:hypothetical protein
VKFLFDHDVPEDLTYLLQELGHDVVRLRDVLQQEAAEGRAAERAALFSLLERAGETGLENNINFA